MKIHNLAVANFKKTCNLDKFYTWSRDMVMWYWSADALFWQLSIDHEMDREYKIAEVSAACTGWPVWAPFCATSSSNVRTRPRAICRWSWWPWENEWMGSIGMELRYNECRTAKSTSTLSNPFPLFLQKTWNINKSSLKIFSVFCWPLH